MGMHTVKIPDSGARTNFTTGAVRDAMEGKGLPSLIPEFPLYLLSHRLEEGARKYTRDNWRKGMPLSRFIDGLERHKRKWLAGWEDEDHEGAMLFNLVGLIETSHRIRMGQLPAELDDLHGKPVSWRLTQKPKNWALSDLYMHAEKCPYQQTEADRKREGSSMKCPDNIDAAQFASPSQSTTSKDS